MLYPVGAVVKSKTTEESLYFLDCDTNPLSDLRLVPLWKDVDVRLQGAGVDDSFVPGRHTQRQKTDKDREQLLIVFPCWLM